MQRGPRPPLTVRLPRSVIGHKPPHASTVSSRTSEPARSRPGGRLSAFIHREPTELGCGHARKAINASMSDITSSRSVMGLTIVGYIPVVYKRLFRRDTLLWIGQYPKGHLGASMSWQERRTPNARFGHNKNRAGAPCWAQQNGGQDDIEEGRWGRDLYPIRGDQNNIYMDWDISYFLLTSGNIPLLIVITSAGGLSPRRVSEHSGFPNHCTASCAGEMDFSRRH